MNNPVTATVQIDARPELVYRLITDLPTLASLAEETVAMELRKGDVISKGTVFVGHNENSGRRWTTKCTVTDAEPGRVFAFDVRHMVFPIARWQYDIVACRRWLPSHREHLGPAARLVPQARRPGHRRHRSGGRQHRAHPAHPAAPQATR